MGGRAPLLLLPLLLLALPAALAQVTQRTSASVPVPKGGGDVTVSITNDLGPTSVSVLFGSAEIAIDITYTAADAAALAALVAQQPNATVTSTQISLALVGSSSVPATSLGGSCQLQTFSASSPRPPCMPLAYTPSPSASATRSATDAAFVLLTVPEHTTVCVNGFCAEPLWYALPPLSPQKFVDLGNGAVYDGTQGLMWQQDLLPAEYPYVSFPSPSDDNFGTINSAANACYALRIGGYSDWRLPTRSELHRWADHTVSPAQNSSFFPVTNTTKDEAYWTVIRSKVNDYLGVYLMQYGGDGGITYNGDVAYAPSQRARCVRTVINKVPPSDRFALSPSGDTALDQYTGLVWQVNPDRTEYTNAQGATPAIAKCDALTLDGYDDWRLPSNKEMASFMDESRAGPAWNVTVFPDFSGANGFWWSSNYNVQFGTKWWAWSGSDGVSYVNVSPGRGRCVRGPDSASACTTCRPPPPPPSGSKGGLSGGAKAGIAIGVIIIVALLAVGGFFAYKHFIANKGGKRGSTWKISV